VNFKGTSTQRSVLGSVKNTILHNDSIPSRLRDVDSDSNLITTHT